jgi:hypothetical protein
MLKWPNWNITNVVTSVCCPSKITEDWIHLFSTTILVLEFGTILMGNGNMLIGCSSSPRDGLIILFFTEVVILTAWHIWKQRNEAIFQNIQPSFSAWTRCFVHEVTLRGHKVKSKHSQLW